MLAGIEKKLVGFFDDFGDVGMMNITVSIIKTDQGHKVKTACLAAKQWKYLPSVKVVVNVEIFFTNKRMTLGLEEDPQAAIMLFYRNQATVNRKSFDVSGFEVFDNGI